MLVQKARCKEQRIKQKNDYAPLYERNVKAFYALLDEGYFVVQILCAEEIPGGYEEQRHVPQVDEIHQIVRTVGMSYNHADNGESLAYRDCGISHSVRRLFNKLVVCKLWSRCLFVNQFLAFHPFERCVDVFLLHLYSHVTLN